LFPQVALALALITRNFIQNPKNHVYPKRPSADHIRLSIIQYPMSIMH
jgi:hypothetical protein